MWQGVLYTHSDTNNTTNADANNATDNFTLAEFAIGKSHKKYS